MNIDILISKLTINELNSLKEIIEKELIIKIEKEKGIVKIKKVDMSNRLFCVLLNANISTLNQLTLITEDEFKSFKNAGNRSLKEVNDLLLKHGMSFKINK